jgi:hypothetical protein
MESINASQMRYPLRDHKEERRSLQHAELQLENAKALPVATLGSGLELMVWSSGLFSFSFSLHLSLSGILPQYA